MTFHLSFSPSLCGHLDQQLPQGQQRTGQIQAAGQEGKDGRTVVMARGKHKNGRVCMHIYGRRSGGHGQELQSFYVVPSRVWSSSSVFVRDGRGMRKSSTFLTTCTGTQTHAHSSLSPKAPPPVGQHHTQGQTTTPQPHHNPPCLLLAVPTPRNGGCSHTPTDTLQPPGKRKRAGGKEEEGWQ